MHPPLKIDFKIQNTKVAFDTVRRKTREKGPETPEYCKSALPQQNAQKMDLVNFGVVGVGVRNWESSAYPVLPSLVFGDFLFFPCEDFFVSCLSIFQWWV